MPKRYSFTAEDIQKRAQTASELKKKSLAQRAAKAAASGDAKGPKKESTKKVAAAPKIDLAAKKRESVDRRNFLFGTAAFAGAIGVTAGGVQRFLFPRILFEPPSVFDAGRADSIMPNQPMFFKDNRTWMIRTANRIYALSGRCTHLGCTPSWLSADQKFKCPCHGSGFRMNGVNFEGPAPRALERYKIWMVGSTIMVDKSKFFLYEKNEWESPDSYLVV